VQFTKKKSQTISMDQMNEWSNREGTGHSSIESGFVCDLARDLEYRNIVSRRV
jgi:hypothetical protein